MNRETPWRAVLVPDAGQRAVSSDYFRSEQHLRAEGVTHSLIVEDGAGRALRVPLIVRPIEGTGYRDAVSPYGFPGAELNGLSEVPVDAIDWRGTELVSLFLRDRIGGPYCFAGGQPRREVCLIDPRLPVRFRRDHGGAEYCASEAWFEEVFTCPFAWLVTTRAPDGAVASSALVVLSDGLLHHFIGGTADAYLAHAPQKNEVPVMVELAENLEASVHLGGGVQPGDALEQSKRGFANAASRFYTHDLICDPEAYARLSQGHAAGGFFPAYRAPRS